MSRKKEPNQATAKPNRFLSVVGIFLCIVFGAVLICNLVIIVKSNISPEDPPSVFGIAPFTVLSGSMSGDREGHLEIGDLLLVQEVDASELKVGDVISFVASGSVTTHRIVKITEEDGELQFTTKGDANNTIDQLPVFEHQLVGRYLLRIPKLGNFALFLREPLGMLLCIIVPLLLFIGIDVLTRRRSSTGAREEQSELALENARLRAMLEGRSEQVVPVVQELPPVVQELSPVTQTEPPANIVVEPLPVDVPFVEEDIVGKEPPVVVLTPPPPLEQTTNVSETEQPAMPVDASPKEEKKEQPDIEEILAYVRNLYAEKNKPKPTPVSEPLEVASPSSPVSEAVVTPPEPAPVETAASPEPTPVIATPSAPTLVTAEPRPTSVPIEEAAPFEPTPVTATEPPTPAPIKVPAPIREQKKPQVQKVHVKRTPVSKTVQTKKHSVRVVRH